MYNEESRKLLYEAQYFKEKLDQAKIDLYHSRKQLVEAEKY
jgi:hypothetical protein